ncbi:MAG: L,D-transpeptidase family protein [Pseudonocardia sp.]|nr:L,D-transpeptidase family protein [Pseudonocardia sp.]
MLTPSISPGAQNVGITEPLVITASRGTLTSVTATGPGGKPLDGTLSPDRTRWTSAPLAFDAEYTATAAGMGTDGRPSANLTTTFRTVTPAHALQVRYVRPTNGQQVGVGMPISIYFNRAVTDRAAVERRLRIQTSVPTEGSFRWVGDDQVNWRPREFWTAGTAVTVVSALRGVDGGGGTFGVADHTSSFTIGRSQMAVGDAASHTLTLFADGAPIRTFPASFGRPNYPTQYGMHVAFEKHLSERMRSDSWGGPEEGEPGFYDEVLPLAVRISNNGEFVHVNGATVAQQGRSNVSHGCVNLSPANGRIFYDWVQIGDPVNIINSGRPLTEADGDISDWLMSWEEYTAGSALHDADATATSAPGPVLER